MTDHACLLSALQGLSEQDRARLLAQLAPVPPAPQQSLSQGSQAPVPPAPQQSLSQGSQQDISASQASQYDAYCLDDDAFAQMEIPGEVPMSAPPAAVPVPAPPAPVAADAASGGGLVRDEEWQAIINTELRKGELLGIVAAAGSGKSTVLQDYAAHRRNLRFLYLTFNKDVQREKQDEFRRARLIHVDVVTTHSLAYTPTKALHKGNVSGKLFVPWGLLHDGRRDPQDKMAAVKAVDAVLKLFIASDDAEISDSHRAGRPPRPGEWDEVAAARLVWSAMCDPKCAEVKLTHDGYVKAFQLDSRAQEAALQRYDVVMLDEAHDCTAAQISIVERASCAKLVVYDPHQCIYQFRGARDASTLERLPAVAHRPLTQTWRYGAPLSDAASALVQHYKGGRYSDFSIRGNPHTTTTLRVEPGRAAGAYSGGQLVVLARLNKTLFGEALAVLQHGGAAAHRFQFLTDDGGAPRLQECEQVVALKLGNWHQIPDKAYFVKRFAKHGHGGGYEAFKQAVEKAGDDRVEYADAIGLVERYGAALEEHIGALKQATVFQRDRATLIFSTTHRAKGLGWQKVYLCDDYIARGLSVAEAAEAAKKALMQQGGRHRSTLELVGEPESLLAALRLSLTEEVNCLYVAATRAKEELLVAPKTASWLGLAGVPECEAEYKAPPQARVAPPPAAVDLCVGASLSSSPLLSYCSTAPVRLPASFSCPSRGAATLPVNAYVRGHQSGLTLAQLCAAASPTTVCKHLRAGLLRGETIALERLSREAQRPLEGRRFAFPDANQWRLLASAERATGVDASVEGTRLKPLVEQILGGDAQRCDSAALGGWYEAARWYATLRCCGFSGEGEPRAPAPPAPASSRRKPAKPAKPAAASSATPKATPKAGARKEAAPPSGRGSRPEARGARRAAAVRGVPLPQLAGRRVVVVYEECGGRVEYPGTLRRYDAAQGLLVHFDGYAAGEPDGECWVDEAGEDEWRWEGAAAAAAPEDGAEEEVTLLGSRSLEERNAIGFANAISVEEGGQLDGQAAQEAKEKEEKEEAPRSSRRARRKSSKALESVAAAEVAKENRSPSIGGGKRRCR